MAPAECALGGLRGAGAAEGGTHSAGHATGAGLGSDHHDVPWAVNDMHLMLTFPEPHCRPPDLPRVEMVIDADFCEWGVPRKI